MELPRVIKVPVDMGVHPVVILPIDASQAVEAWWKVEVKQVGFFPASRKEYKLQHIQYTYSREFVITYLSLFPSITCSTLVIASPNFHIFYLHFTHSCAPNNLITSFSEQFPISELYNNNFLSIEYEIPIPWFPLIYYQI